MLKIVACDDDIKFLELLKTMIESKLDFHYSLNVTSHPEQLEEFLDKLGGNVDVLFMDIVLNNLNGVDFAAKIVKKYSNIKVIFLTGYRDEYSEALFLKIKPYGILGKPIKEALFYAMLKKAYEDRDLWKTSIYTIKTKGGIFNIPLKDIFYIESCKRIVTIHTKTEQSYVCYSNLKQILSEIPGNFLQCHKSFIINMDYVSAYLPKEIVLQNGQHINISQSKAGLVRKIYFEYMGATL